MQIYRQVSSKGSVFIWSAKEKSIECNFKKSMPKHSILILVLYFGVYKKHQKYRIINITFTQDLHKQTSSLLIVRLCYNLVRTLKNLYLLKTKTTENTWKNRIIVFFYLYSILKCFFGQIWSQKLKFSKLTEIWYRHKLLYPCFEFNVNFFNFFSLIFFGANLVPKSEVLQVNWNLVPGYIAIGLSRL